MAIVPILLRWTGGTDANVPLGWPCTGSTTPTGSTSCPTGLTYVRPAEWPTTTLTGTQMFKGLYAVYNTHNNEIRLQVQGNYHVDWGDGSSNYYASNAIAYHNYSYENVTATTFRKYKPAVVTITPSGASNLTYFDLGMKGNTGLTNTWVVPWLEMKFIAPNCDTLWVRSSNNYTGNYVNQTMLENFVFSGTSVITNGGQKFTNFFYLCENLQGVDAPDMITHSQSLNYMFAGCHGLKIGPTLNVYTGTSSGQLDVSYMFLECYNMVYAPFYNIRSSWSATGMFYDCWRLEALGGLDTTSRVFAGQCYLDNGFRNCYALKDIGTLVSREDEGYGLILTNAFLNCSSLSKVILSGLTTSNVDFTNCAFAREELVDIFTALGTATAKTITVTGCPGTANLSAGDIQIATDKGWTVTT